MSRSMSKKEAAAAASLTDTGAPSRSLSAAALRRRLLVPSVVVSSKFFFLLPAFLAATTSLIPAANHLPSFIIQVQAAPAEDRVHSLPLYGPPPTRHYSGHLDGTSGCDTTVNGNYCRLHYWYAEAEVGPDGKSAKDKPVILWLNGGPGSSSVFGFLEELGPLLINATGGLMENPYAWTKVANILALESPVGVGFSYCQAMTELDSDTGHPKLCRNTDKFTASTARAALVDFFTTKFPELATNEFYITGESYAGVYVPTLAKEILDHVPPETINLVGIGVGDPCTDNTAQADSMDALWYGHKYGLVMDASFDLLWNHCRARAPSAYAKGGEYKIRGKVQQHLVKHFGPTVSSLSEIDYEDEETQEVLRQLIDDVRAPGEQFDYDSDVCQLEYRKFQISTSFGMSQIWDESWLDDYSLFGPGGLSKQGNDLRSYLLRPDVRRALHVDDVPVTDWPNPPQGFDYASEYDACNDIVAPGAPSMIDFYRDIIPRLKVTWIYNGDTDPCVSYEGTRTAVIRIGFSELDGGSYRPWFYNHTSTTVDVLQAKAPMFGPDLLLVNTGAQFGGEVVNYEHNLSFLTLHGSGHMVPQFRPEAALHMLRKFVATGAHGGLRDARDVLSPLLPSNATLRDMSRELFLSTMSDWTKKAKGSPYVMSFEQEELDTTAEIIVPGGVGDGIDVYVDAEKDEIAA